ncbi:UBA domain-containing protein [Fusibacter ferrireducens]|uniref:DUF4342 domain-containing protein n=1 Tax=Fusibacter ferrireducens TaxID=2785058 RepID=A0ABR9ZSW3_9FIRM|nr:DUF4342 domain-containing protein [Fusibacter ferrireducens]MBF4692970.1 DUF4342 domain-containing protein [Fusibacter ferrireducens]
MSLSLEKIDLLMERANVSYKEAKETLEETDGDLLEALIRLEKAEKILEPEKSASEKNRATKEAIKSKSKSFFNDLKETRFKIKNKEKDVVDVSLLTASIATLVTMPVSIFVLATPYLFGHKIVVGKEPLETKKDSETEK